MTEAIAPSEAAVLHVAARDIPVPQLVSPEAQAMLGLGPMGDDSPYPPLFGDFSKGFPPTLLTAGTRDAFLSNAVRMHRSLRAAGVEAELHVQEAAPHGGFFMSAPEDFEIEAEVRRSIDRHWASRTS